MPLGPLAPYSNTRKNACTHLSFFSLYPSSTFYLNTWSKLAPTHLSFLSLYPSPRSAAPPKYWAACTDIHRARASIPLFGGANHAGGVYLSGNRFALLCSSVRCKLKITGETGIAYSMLEVTCNHTHTPCLMSCFKTCLKSLVTTHTPCLKRCLKACLKSLVTTCWQPTSQMQAKLHALPV